MSINLLRQLKNLNNKQNYILEKAEYYFSNNEFENSIKLTEKIQVNSPLFKTASLIKAKANWKLGNLNLALEQLNYLVNLEPTLIESYLLISKIYFEIRDFKNSKKILTLAKERISYCEVLCPELENLLKASELELNRTIKIKLNSLKNFCSTNLFKELPIDCIYLLFSYLNFNDLCNSTLVCKQWNFDLIKIPQIWNSLNFNFERKTRLIANSAIITQLTPFFKRSGSRLKQLSISNSTITELTLFPLYFKGKELQLSSLNLINCELESKLLNKIITVLGSSLKVLDISSIRGNLPNLELILKICKNLNSLNLSNISNFNDLAITDSLIKLGEEVENIPKLKSLKLRANSLSRSRFQAFLQLFPQLIELDISYSKNLSIESLKNICKFNSKLVSLGVSGLYSVQDLSLERCLLHLLSSCQKLKHLEFANYPNLPDSLITLSVGFTDILVSLDFSHCRQVSNNALEAIALGCPNLQDLKLTNCPLISDAGLKPLLRYCPLKSLVISFNPRITDSMFEYLIQLPTNLEVLEIENCAELSARGLIPYCKHKNSLKLQVLKLGAIGSLDLECFNWLKLRFNRVKFSVNY